MTALIALTWLAIAIVVYHHAAYPLLLRVLAKRRAEAPLDFVTPAYASAPSGNWPSIGVLMPCYNEASVIADKLINLASMDYPAQQLTVYVVCDGCTDDTAARARAAAASSLCRDLNIKVIEHLINRGKLACLNEAVASMSEDLLALTDASALVSLDAFAIAAARFADDRVGALCGRYVLLNSGGTGQSTYWNYQVFIKQQEDAIGSTLGAHGAFYMLRRHLFQPPALHIINDDFVIPMSVIRQGYRVRYEPRILALELEHMDERDEARRRERISQGNVQMVLHLLDMIHPRYGSTAFTFLSGKVMRAFMPAIMLFALLGSLAGASANFYLALAALGQVLGYTAALWQQLMPNSPNWAILRIIHYIVAGHVAGGLGLFRYFFQKDRLRWR